ncbi:MAG: hypothetical protein H6585_10615 [Flavobacteriales bacterium]|nr:hypothetical protein [Flavobacteriales bacterium]MCB9448784.1 hypothetical protein [Flavobacteriales bacterium]
MTKGAVFHKFRLLFCILLMAFVPARSQQMEARAGLDTNLLTIGDQTVFKLMVQTNPRTSVIWPQLSDTLTNGLLIIGESKIDTVVNPDTKVTLLTKPYLITSFDSGHYTIPSFLFRDAKDTSITSSTGALNLDVITVQVDTTQAIRNIKEPMDAPLTWQEMKTLILIVALVVFALLFFLWYFIFREKKKQVENTEPVVQLPPHEEALLALRALEEEKLWQQGDIKTYHTRLTDILREYIERQFGISAMEMTSNEVLTAMRSRVDAGLLQKHLRPLFTLADMVKFAKAQPLASEHEVNLRLAVEFVQATATPLEDQERESANETDGHEGN